VKVAAWWQRRARDAAHTRSRIVSQRTRRSPPRSAQLPACRRCPGERGISAHETSMSAFRSRCRPRDIRHQPSSSGWPAKSNYSRFRQRAAKPSGCPQGPVETGALQAPCRRVGGVAVYIGKTHALSARTAAAHFYCNTQFAYLSLNIWSSRVRPTVIVCLDCGKQFSILRRHLMTDHKITLEQYRELPSSYQLVAPDYAKTRSTLAERFGLGRKGQADGFHVTGRWPYCSGIGYCTCDLYGRQTWHCSHEPRLEHAGA
jgi:predicted transcriptional regulator